MSECRVSQNGMDGEQGWWFVEKQSGDKGILATSQGLVKEKALSSAKQGTDLKMGLCPAQCENSEICIEESKKSKTALQERER
ncbi:hypothetical protein Anapl_05978 [Anas platyrhynchos]|uniref:Uncharacterized protein n=1 Tax=Anas platyrhynchos TaxID=8839 RepID=R0JWK8_ANAPL|nr:hypothetical protein Anapl_05978 [Anas platyrhynchos]